MEFVAARLRAGDLRAVVDRPRGHVEAYHDVESGQKTGIVVIDMPSAHPAQPAT